MTKWRDVIQLDRASVKGFPEHAARISKFLDEIENKPEGVDLMADIRKKFAPSKKVLLTFNNTSRSGYMNGTTLLHINLQDFDTIQVVDSKTKQLTPVGFQQIVLHELVHAADPKLSVDNPNDPYVRKGVNGVAPSEIYAVNRTNQIMRKYYPQLPEYNDYLRVWDTGKVDAAKSLATARENPSVGSAALIEICLNKYKFEYGYVTATDKIFCQNLPESRFTEKPKPPSNSR
jgi:hypothetical protein